MGKIVEINAGRLKVDGIARGKVEHADVIGTIMAVNRSTVTIATDDNGGKHRHGAAFVRRGDGGCNGRNEICVGSVPPCGSASTRSACEKLCAADATCVSYEWKESSATCAMSTTCTNSIRVADDQGSDGWVMYERTRLVSFVNPEVKGADDIVWQLRGDCRDRKGRK